MCPKMPSFMITVMHADDLSSQKCVSLNKLYIFNMFGELIWTQVLACWRELSPPTAANTYASLAWRLSSQYYVLKLQMAVFDAVNEVFLTGTTFFTCLVDVQSDGFAQKGAWWCNANLMEAVFVPT